MTYKMEAGITTSIWRLATIWKNGIQSPASGGSFICHRVQSHSGTHPASYPQYFPPGVK